MQHAAISITLANRYDDADQGTSIKYEAASRPSAGEDFLLEQARLRDISTQHEAYVLIRKHASQPFEAARILQVDLLQPRESPWKPAVFNLQVSPERKVCSVLPKYHTFRFKLGAMESLGFVPMAGNVQPSFTFCVPTENAPT